MDSLSLVAALLCLAAVTWAGYANALAQRRMRELSLQLQADAARLVELRYVEEVRRQMEEAQWLTERAVEVGTETVREVHMGISGATFGILDAIPVTRDTARIVRHTHDLISESVYGSIRTSNKVAGRLSRSAIGLHAPKRRNRRDRLADDSKGDPADRD